MEGGAREERLVGVGCEEKRKEVHFLVVR